MSFDIYIVSFKQGDNGTFPYAIVETAFRELIDYREAAGWGLTLPDYGPCSGFVYIRDKPDIEHFSVNRPPDDPAFWDALYEVMRQTPTVLFWPGKTPSICVANAAVLDDLPPSMLEELGGLPPVTSGEELENRVSATR